MTPQLVQTIGLWLIRVMLVAGAIIAALLDNMPVTWLLGGVAFLSFTMNEP